MSKLKLTQKGYENYTGQIGMYEFVDGVSLENIPGLEIDRLAAAFQCVELRDDGGENEAGAAYRLVYERNARAPVMLPSAKQSQEDKDRELREENKSAIVFHSVEELEAIAEERGIEGLREIAKPLGVKNRSIPGLLKNIVEAQSQRRASQPSPAEPEIETVTSASEAAAEDDDDLPMLDEIKSPPAIVTDEDDDLPMLDDIEAAEIVDAD